MYQFDDEAKSVGTTLLALRQAVGLTQEQLAEKAKVSASAYSRHETGREAPSIRIVARYARELGLHLPEFFRIHDEIQKAIRRTSESPAWWLNVDESVHAENARALDRRRAADEFAAAATRAIEVLYRTLGRS